MQIRLIQFSPDKSMKNERMQVVGIRRSDRQAAQNPPSVDRKQRLKYRIKSHKQRIKWRNTRIANSEQDQQFRSYKSNKIRPTITEENLSNRVIPKQETQNRTNHCQRDSDNKRIINLMSNKTDGG